MRGNKGEILSKLSLLVTMMIITMVKSSSLNYSDALTKSILFFEGQRSGPLPPSQRMKWRKDSALNDGSDIYVSKLYALIFRHFKYAVLHLDFISLNRLNNRYWI